MRETEKENRSRKGKEQHRCFRVLSGKLRAAFVIAAAVLALTGCASSELYSLREQAVEQFQAGSYEEALKLFNEALSYGNGEVSETEFDILRYRAECELRTRDFEAAEKTCQILMELDPSEENREFYADLQEQAGRAEELNAAFAVMASGDYEKAYEAMDQYAALGGDASEALAWYNKAVCAEYLGRWEEAEELFAQYLKAYPEDEEAQKEYRFVQSRVSGGD